MKKDICALIVTYNFDNTFFECINSIKNQVDKILIIDNNSNDLCKSKLHDLLKDKCIDVIFNNKNIGIAAAINKGISYAKENRYKWIITLDDDSISDKSMVNYMLNKYLQLNNEDIKVICPNIYDLNIKEYCNKSINEYELIDKCIQSGMMINLNVFDKVGKFNEELFIYYVDDDFCERLSNNEFKILRVNNAILYHRDGKYIKKSFLGKEFNYNERSNLSIYYRARNNIYMINKYDKLYIVDNIKDFIKICIYSKEKLSNIKFYLKGIYHAIIGNYGMFENVHSDL